ncbi:MAG: hypothetical protein CMK00_03755 [Planctomycetes bacterium]|nr:hypothetical protein [Planctomycetota bacterium]
MVEIALDNYRGLLEGLRRGDNSLALELEQAARTLCRDHGRCDAAAVARYYLELTPAGRARSWRDELAWRALWKRARSSDGEQPVDRELLLADLGAFSAEVLEHEDPLPGARALSLAVRLTVHRLERAGVPDAPQRARLEADTRRVERLFAAAGMITPRLEPLWTRGRLAHLAGREAEARAAFSECLRLAEQVGSDDYREHALLGLVALARTAGNTLEARRALGELATFRSPRDSWPLTREWATDILHRDQPESALAFLRDHPPRRASEGQPTHQAQTMTGGADLAAWQLLVGSCALRCDDLETARTYLDQLALNPAADDSDGQVSADKVRLARATLELAEGQPQRALETLGSGAAPASAADRAHAHALRGEALLTLGRPGPAQAELAAALAQAGDWARSRGLADPASGGSIIGEWLGLHTVALLARALLELDEPLAAALTIERTQSASLRTRADELTEEDLLAWASSMDLGLITWVLGADGGVAVHISQSGVARGRTIDHGRRSLGEAIRRLRRAALEGQTERHQILGAQLRDELLPPSALKALEAAPPGAGKRILFIPHGPLEELPLALISLRERPLDEWVTPLVLPGLPHPSPASQRRVPGTAQAPITPGTASNAAAIPASAPANTAEAPRAPGPSTPWILAGNPVAAPPHAHPLLPGAADELALLARQLPATTVTIQGADFTRQALSAALGSTGALHIATHLATQDACRSRRLASVGLRLSHGELLCADKIAALRPRLSLVVLGACETAQGRPVDGEGLLGLTRVFLESGTRNLLATLWPVEDSAARDFALAFHRALAAGQTPSQAASNSRNTLRAGGAPAADWAAFRLLGRD